MSDELIINLCVNEEIVNKSEIGTKFVKIKIHVPILAMIAYIIFFSFLE